MTNAIKAALASASSMRELCTEPRAQIPHSIQEDKNVKQWLRRQASHEVIGSVNGGQSPSVVGDLLSECVEEGTVEKYSGIFTH
jgi:hypothetical protein